MVAVVVAVVVAVAVEKAWSPLAETSTFPPALIASEKTSSFGRKRLPAD